jgi:tetratricopeptide (TPR) repeat protein
VVGHPTEETLAGYATEGHATESVREHCAVCVECARVVKEYRLITASMKRDEAWTQPTFTGRHSQMKSLQMFAARREGDRTVALEFVELLRNQDPGAWNIHELPRTVGMVLELIGLVRVRKQQEPAVALAIARIAEDVLEHVDRGRYESAEISYARGRIAKEASLVLRYLGRYEEALAALDRAERDFREIPCPEFDLATVAYNRAMMFSEIDRCEEGLALLESARVEFGAVNSLQRVLNCELLRAALLYYLGRVDDARGIYEELLHSGRLDRQITPFAMRNLAFCRIDAGDYEVAAEWGRRAADLFLQTDNPVSAIGARWAVGKAKLHSGDSGGVMFLRVVASEYRQLGMPTDASLVLLDIVEFLIRKGENDEAASLCGTALRDLVPAGLRSSATTAMAHLRDLAARGEARNEDLKHARHVLADRLAVSDRFPS